MKIVYQDNQLCLRGTTVAVYDYALHNKLIMGYDPVIVYDKNHRFNDSKVISKFINTFGSESVIGYQDTNDMKRICDKVKADIFYSMKAGLNDGIVADNIKNCIHSVFQLKQPHGDVYAYISKWLADKMGGDYPNVPYIVDLPKVGGDFREFLNIPRDAFVLGRHGGYDTFDIGFAKEAIIETINSRSNLYYVFVNTEPFYKHERIRYVDNIVGLDSKTKFINTCDAMIHARNQGESFGLAIAEFSLLNKPVILYGGGVDLNHVEMLKNVGVFYKNKQELMNILLNYERNDNMNYDVVSDKYSPSIVTNIFKDVFVGVTNT